MAIGGVVITVNPSDRRSIELALLRFSELQVYGSDENGNIIATIKSIDSQSIEHMINTIEKLDSVQKVHLAYLNSDNSNDGPN